MVDCRCWAISAGSTRAATTSWRSSSLQASLVSSGCRYDLAVAGHMMQRCERGSLVREVREGKNCGGLFGGWTAMPRWLAKRETRAVGVSEQCRLRACFCCGRLRMDHVGLCGHALAIYTLLMPHSCAAFCMSCLLCLLCRGAGVVPHPVRLCWHLGDRGQG